MNIKIGDKVNMLCWESIEHIGIVSRIDGHFVTIKKSDGKLATSAMVCCILIK